MQLAKEKFNHFCILYVNDLSEEWRKFDGGVCVNILDQVISAGNGSSYRRLGLEFNWSYQVTEEVYVGVQKINKYSQKLKSAIAEYAVAIKEASQKTGLPSVTKKIKL